MHLIRSTATNSGASGVFTYIGINIRGAGGIWERIWPKNAAHSQWPKADQSLAPSCSSAHRGTPSLRVLRGRLAAHNHLGRAVCCHRRGWGMLELVELGQLLLRGMLDLVGYNGVVTMEARTASKTGTRVGCMGRILYPLGRTRTKHNPQELVGIYISIYIYIHMR